MLKIGKVVNTHGIKGEIRIISDFEYKNIVFQKGNHLYINNDELIINSYRVHKNYDMITLKSITNINDVLKYKGYDVYINKNDYKFNGILDDELIGVNVYFKNKKIGIIKQIQKGKMQKLFVIYNGKKDILIPYVKPFIKNISSSKVELKEIEGLLNEN